MEEKKTITEKIEELLAIMRKEENCKITGISYHDREHGAISITKTGQY